MSETNDNLRARTARALRAAADAIERGEMPRQITPMGWAPDYCWDEWVTLEEAQDMGKRETEIDGDFWQDDVGSVRWGVFVAVEHAHVDVIDTEEAREKARDLGAREWWEVSLVDAWKEAE